MQKYLIALSVVAYLFVIPTVAGAAGLVAACGGDGQPACQACYVVELVNNVVSWLVMILGVIAAILIVVAGARLVTSGGNSSAKEAAKSSMTNLIIGYVIVLSAWLVMDYGLRALLVEGGSARFGVWNQISCVDQPLSNTVDVAQQDVVYIPLDSALGSLPGWVTAVSTPGGGAGMGGSGVPPGTLNGACTRLPGPPPQAVDCSAQQAQCRNAGGTPSLNSARDTVICTPAQVSSGGGGSGTCQVVSDPSNACHPNRLTCFPNRNLASEICNVESQGGREDVLSGTDLCQDGRSFSVGLWQINILANRNLIPGCNSSFFNSSNGRDQGSCIQYRTNSGGVRYCQYRSCRITNVAVYNQCVRNAQVPANNTAAACRLMATQGWSAWQTSYNRCR